MAVFSTHTINVTTAADGSATKYGPAVNGMIYGIYVNQGTLTDGAADITVSYESGSGDNVTLLTLTDVGDDGMYYPRELEGDNAGADATNRVLPLAVGRLKVVVAQGGNAKTGSVVVYMME